MSQEYETGYTLGKIKGDDDSRLLVSPYPYTEEGSQIYQEGFRNGYFKRYTKGLSNLLKENPSEEAREIIAIRLDEISNLMVTENKKQK